eukprot:1876827-Rhodomonas_salina.1
MSAQSARPRGVAFSNPRADAVLTSGTAPYAVSTGHRAGAKEVVHLCRLPRARIQDIGQGEVRRAGGATCCVSYKKYR